MTDLDFKCPHCKGWVAGDAIAQQQHVDNCVYRPLDQPVPRELCEYRMTQLQKDSLDAAHAILSGAIRVLERNKPEEPALSSLRLALSELVDAGARKP